MVSRILNKEPDIFIFAKTAVPVTIWTFLLFDVDIFD